MLFTQRDYDKEIDFLKKEILEIKEFMSNMNTDIPRSNNYQEISSEEIITLIKIKNTEKVLSCIGNSTKLNMLTAILQKPMTVAELVEECKLNSTGQAYHHIKPLISTELVVEEEKGRYSINKSKETGIKTLISSIANLS